MTTDAAIKAALDAAARGIDAYRRAENAKLGVDWDAAPEISAPMWRPEAAAAIAAFLRALPDWHEIEGRSVSAAYLAVLAAAVEAAAHDR